MFAYVISQISPTYRLQTDSTIAASQYRAAGIDSSFKLQRFNESLSINILRYTDHNPASDMVFEIKGISCAMANTLRRIMIAEVPTMAIEHVFVINNTSIIQDEVLAHRLGLIPIAVDPRLFELKAEDDAPCEKNTIVMKLKIECKRLPDGTIVNDKVHSDHLEWLPEGSEIPEETNTTFTSTQKSDNLQEVRPVHHDILIAKLRPGQAIEVECHCTKGSGEEHAKWSPVATAWYRLYPEVAILQRPPTDIANELIEELPGLLQLQKNSEMEVDDALRHEILLEKVRRLSGEPRYAPYIQLRKRKDHFIFTIESTGAYKPHEIFQLAIDRIVSKCDKVLEGLGEFPEPSFIYE